MSDEQLRVVGNWKSDRVPKEYVEKSSMTSEKLTNIVLQNQIITQITSQSQNVTTITNDTPKSFIPNFYGSTTNHFEK